MLASTTSLSARSPGEAATHRKARSQGLTTALAVLLVFMLLLMAAAAFFLNQLEGVVAIAARAQAEFLVHDLIWIGGLLTMILLLAAALGVMWRRQQKRARRLHEAEALQRALDLVARAEAAQAASLSKTRFLSQLSHELRSPLNAILGFVQLLDIHPDIALTPTSHHWIEGMAQAAWHLHAVLEDLSDIAQIEAGLPRHQIQAVAVEPLIAEALRMVQLQADHAGVQLAFASQPSSACFAKADPLRLRQILLNLLTNAIKYGRNGGHVLIELWSETQLVHLQVIDDGIGMDSSQLAQLFEPYNRLGRENSAISGTGIGLSLVRQWVQLMQGDIQVESEVGAGTTVHLRLPAAVPSSARPNP